MTVKLNILIIEDSEPDVVLLQEIMFQFIDPSSVKFMEAARLVDAFRIIQKNQFDLVILDLNLLDIQGLASVAALHAELPNIPIVVYSGMDDPKLGEQAIVCGAHSYLVKGRETGERLREIIHEIIPVAISA